MIPRQWKVIQTVREKFSCRDCETITQPPAPFHVTPRGFAGPNLLAMVLFEKFGQHQPLNRQSERYAREGIELSLSTLADQVGACAAVLKPLHALIEAHVLAAERLHGDDTTVPILAKGKTDTGRIWVYVRDDRPFGGAVAAGGAVLRISRDRSARASRTAPEAASPASCRPMPMPATTGFTLPDRKPGPVTEALCWAMRGASSSCLPTSRPMRARGKNAPPISPLALEAVKRIDCAVRHRARHQRPGRRPNVWLRVRTGASPLVAELGRVDARPSGPSSRDTHPVAQAIDYMLKRWEGFTRFLDDGRICLTNNAAERALRGFALGRKSWLFAGSDRGADRAAVMYTLIATAKLNDVDPQAWLADVLARIADMPQRRLAELLPWNWKAQSARLAA